MQKETIRQILEAHISYQKIEIMKLKKFKKDSKTVKKQLYKSHGQLRTIQRIAKDMGFVVCESCGRLK